MQSRRFVTSLALLAALFAAAWGSADAASTVTVKVTLKNKPLAGATVTQTVNGVKSPPEKTDQNGEAVFAVHNANTEYCWKAVHIGYGNSLASAQKCAHPAPASVTLAL